MVFAFFGKWFLVFTVGILSCRYLQDLTRWPLAGVTPFCFFTSFCQEGRNMYVVSIIPQEMAWEVAHPSVLLCGSRRKQLNKNTKPPYKKRKHEYPHEAGFDWMTHVFEANLWIATGYTRSQFHYDKEWNVNCLLSGTKRWIFLDPLLGLDTQKATTLVYSSLYSKWILYTHAASEGIQSRSIYINTSVQVFSDWHNRTEFQIRSIRSPVCFQSAIQSKV